MKENLKGHREKHLPEGRRAQGCMIGEALSIEPGMTHQ